MNTEKQYPMPALTKQERAELVLRYAEKEEELIRSIDRCDAIGCTSSLTVYQLDLKAVRITLSALTAQPEGYRVRYHNEPEGSGTRIGADKLGYYQSRGDFHYTPTYTAPPVPVLAGNSSGLPNGWKLVPVEPSKEMVVAGQDKLDECIDHGFDSDEDGSVYEYSKIAPDAPYQVFMAMMGSAPLPPSIAD